MCRVLNVRRSGYYAWKRPRPNDRQAEAKRLDEAIRRVFDAHKGRYGSPRVWEDLKAEGWRVGRPRVARRMQALGLKARAARKFKATTQSKHTLPVAPNRLEQDFTASAPNQKWVADITYLWTGEGWLYLAVVLDLYSRKAVGWSMMATLTADLVEDALKMALYERNPDPGLLHHSDRGSQYASGQIRQLLEAQHITVSMSRTANCYDNAVMESFFSTLKCEWVYYQNYRTRAEASRDIFAYIAGFYNRVRLHSTLGYLSPEEFEVQDGKSP